MWTCPAYLSFVGSRTNSAKAPLEPYSWELGLERDLAVLHEYSKNGKSSACLAGLTVNRLRPQTDKKGKHGYVHTLRGN